LPFKKSGGFTESSQNRQTIESLRALKSPRLVKNQRDWKSWRFAHCLGSAESPAADFLLVWLKSSRSDPAFMGELSPVLYRLFVPARHAKKWPKSTWQPKFRRREISLLPAKSQKS
jgi:hypothetical protein